MKSYVENMINLQNSLILEFSKIYPNLIDLDFLLDFPTRGDIQLENNVWEFIKHGKGIKFIRKSPRPHIVIDMHTAIFDPYIIDEWRLSQYLESIGVDLQGYDIKKILDNMVTSSNLEKVLNSRCYRYKKLRN